MNTTTNRTLCHQLATKYALPQSTVRQLLADYWTLITHALLQQHRVYLPLGTLHVHFYREHQPNLVVDQPRAPTALLETAHHRRKIVFRPSRRLRAQVRALEPPEHLVDG